jgi:hypothetical protein
VIIDARGRPLALPSEPLARQQMLWDWLVALGVESGPLPYAAAGRLPDLSEPSVAPASNGSITFVEPPAPAPAPAPAPTAAPPPPARPRRIEPESPAQPLDNDLAKLRQTVEKPKKRGFLGRK